MNKKIKEFEKVLGFKFNETEREYCIYWIQEGRDGVVNFYSQEYYDFVQMLMHHV